jgi:hypothetical protein
MTCNSSKLRRLRWRKALAQRLLIASARDAWKWPTSWVANATTADHRSRLGNDGCVRRFTTPRSAAVIHVTAAITLSRSKDTTEAAGRDTKWSAKRSELRAALLSERLSAYGSEFSSGGVLLSPESIHSLAILETGHFLFGPSCWPRLNLVDR